MEPSGGVERGVCGAMPVFEVSMAAIKGSRLMDIAVARIGRSLAYGAAD